MIALLLACAGGPATEATPVAPQAIELAECAVCGMVVREQPAPRGQVHHRDGTHAFTCSLGDLRADLASPSAHGAATAVWVEALPADFDPAAAAPAALPWLAAEDAHYVVGFERRLVMGPPALSFSSEADASTHAQTLGARVVDWAAMRASPLGEDPK